ncbi:MAG: GTPase [Deltaproteobacteria bacterium]|nr:MAG: GTPase [Deltaproteobacteria bacterium]
MSRINPLAKELSAKIVYYGPGLSGKTTSLEFIHRAIRPDRRGEMVSLATEGDRTIFFDFLPLQIDRVRGMDVRLQLYTVPGQVYYAATRKLVLNGADGVVFVADSQADALERNESSLEDLRANLRELGIDLDRFPLVLQYNKRDLPGALPVDTLESHLNARGVPAFETVATRGTGIFDALKAIVRLTIRSLKAQAVAAKAGRADALTGREERELQARPAQVPAAADEVPEARAAEDLARADVRSGPSFAALWAPHDAAVVREVEAQLGERCYGAAVRKAAEAVAEILDRLPGSGEADGPMSKAVLLGLDGREFLRLSRLASLPDEAITEKDALFALYLLVASRVKADAI